MSDVAKKVETLMEAMPYLEKYQGKVIVIKYGGNAMINDELKDAVLHDVVMLKLLGLKPVLSHGGGPGINKMLEKLNIPVQFINGLRYTSEDIMRVVEMVLVGQVNTELVGRINQIGGKAVGLSGVSGDIYHCHKRSEELGFVGDIDYVNADAINAMLDAGFIPVIAPVGTDGQARCGKARHPHRHRGSVQRHQGARRDQLPEHSGREAPQGQGHHRRRHDPQGRLLRRGHRGGRHQRPHHRRPQAPLRTLRGLHHRRHRHHDRHRTAERWHQMVKNT